MNMTQLVLHLNIYALINLSDALTDGVADSLDVGVTAQRTDCRDRITH